LTESLRFLKTNRIALETDASDQTSYLTLLQQRSSFRSQIHVRLARHQTAKKGLFMNPDERQQLISQYEAGHAEVLRNLAGFPPESLRAHPIPGKWSAAEIIHHLADSETTSALRLRRLLVEDHPLIQGYDQDQYAAKLHYDERDITPALEAFRFARETTAQLIHLMTEEDWRREGTHSESGSYTTEDWLRIYAAHAHNHAAQIGRLREALANSSAASA
jgi:hypothetical protein